MSIRSKRELPSTDVGGLDENGKPKKQKTDGILGKCDNENELNDIIMLHLTNLDYYQSSVHNIRIMHHAVWRDLRPDSAIIHERAGSRVERQVRIHHTGSGSDIDYKFIVKGISVTHNVNTERPYLDIVHKGIFGRHAYCIIYTSKQGMEKLNSHESFRKIFQNVFQHSSTESNFVLKPDIFKENVVHNSGFQMQRKDQVPLNSPNIAGQGATNETDAVPCLELEEWPLDVINWHTREMSNQDIFNQEWKLSVMRKVKMYVVPTGNRGSQTEDLEWRLSFTFIEKECFSRVYEVCPKITKLFGLAKYVFKLLIEDIDIFSSYHFKTIFMWKVEEYRMQEWETMQPLHFVEIMISDLSDALARQRIRHFFVADCNIFPIHKLSQEKESLFKSRILTHVEKATSNIGQVLRNDTGVSYSDQWTSEVKQCLNDKLTNGVTVNAYASGYLTRLLSVVVQSVYECERMGSMDKYLSAFKDLFDFHKKVIPLCDTHVRRIIPIAEIEISTVMKISNPGTIYQPIGFKTGQKQTSLQTNNRPKMTGGGKVAFNKDAISLRAQKAFCAYTQQNFDEVEIIVDGSSSTEGFSEYIGIAVTQFHLSKRKSTNYIDFPLLYVEEQLCKMGSTVLRFYLHPRLLFDHLRLQLELRKHKKKNDKKTQDKMQRMTNVLSSTVQAIPNNEPFLGKLSYRHIGALLLRGYRELFREEQLALIINDVEEPDRIAGLRQTTTNFDLR